MARRKRRSMGKRELKCLTREKTEQFRDLYRRDFSKGAMAGALGIRPDQVDELLEAMRLQDARAEQEEEPLVAGGGGNG